MKKIFIGFVLSFALLSFSANALVEIDPASKDLSIFSDLYTGFVFNVTISGVDNVYGFQFDLIYDTDAFEILNESDVSRGNFLNRNGQDQDHCVGPDISVPGVIDNFACSRVGSGNVSGNGTLAEVKLKTKSSVITPATSDIVLSNVKISDINSQPLDNSSQDGNVSVYECLQGETRTCPGGTRTCNSNNEWGSCVTSPGNGGPPGGGPPGGAPPPGDGEDGNGAYIAGDIIDDDCVDIQDLNLVAANFGLSSGFDSRADVNSDGKVDIFDLVIVALDFGRGDNC